MLTPRYSRPRVTAGATSGATDEGAAPSPALAAPPGNPRFPLFDGLRGAAVLAVLLLHTSELSARIGEGVGGRLAEAAGGLGVIVFFIISGFLLYRPFAAAREAGRPGPSTWRYARRRALRIVPAYWVALTILAVFPGIVGVLTGHWWRYYGYLQAYFGGATSSGIPVAWTLCVEVSFYLMLPVWAAGMRRRAAAGRSGLLVTELGPLAVLAATGLVVQLLAARQLVPETLSTTLPGESLWFALGMALGVLSVAEHSAAGRPALVDRLCDRSVVVWLIGAGALAGLVATVPAGGLFGLIATTTQPQHVATALLKLVLEAIAAVTLVLPAVFAGSRPGLTRRILGSGPLVRLGVISYSFYLWHLTIVEFIAVRHSDAFSATGLNLMAHVHGARLTVLFLVSLAAATLVSAASYRFVELPFLRLKESRSAGPADREAVPPGGELYRDRG
jgi:peptidoglycan/LPS O-acetylase OafA/YrhL